MQERPSIDTRCRQSLSTRYSVLSLGQLVPAVNQRRAFLRKSQPLLKIAKKTQIEKAQQKLKGDLLNLMSYRIPSPDNHPTAKKSPVKSGNRLNDFLSELQQTMQKQRVQLQIPIQTMKDSIKQDSITIQNIKDQLDDKLLKQLNQINLSRQSKQPVKLPSPSSIELKIKQIESLIQKLTLQVAILKQQIRILRNQPLRLTFQQKQQIIPFLQSAAVPNIAKLVKLHSYHSSVMIKIYTNPSPQPAKLHLSGEPADWLMDHLKKLNVLPAVCAQRAEKCEYLTISECLQYCYQLTMLQYFIHRLIRPPRKHYSVEHLPISQLRFDWSIQTQRAGSLQVSLFRAQTPNNKLIVYLHGNGSCRLQVKQILPTLLASGFDVITYDFAGCGLSDGTFITMGQFQSQDLSQLVFDLHRRLPFHQIYLWGRSLGAVVALLYLQKNPHPSVKGVLADSPFTDLKKLLLELGFKNFIIPGLFLQPVLSHIFKKVESLYGFDLNKSNVLNRIGQINMPVIFLASKDDQVVDISHSQSLYKYKQGDKWMFYAKGGHNSSRQPRLLKDLLQCLTRQHNISRVATSLQLSSCASTEENQSLPKRKCRKYIWKSF